MFEFRNLTKYGRKSLKMTSRLYNNLFQSFAHKLIKIKFSQSILLIVLGVIFQRRRQIQKYFSKALNG